MDANKDRSLNEGELAEGLALYGLNLNKAQIAVLMRIFDKDGSGLISLKEFLRAMKVSFNFKFFSQLYFLYRVNQQELGPLALERHTKN